MKPCDLEDVKEHREALSQRSHAHDLPWDLVVSARARLIAISKPSFPSDNPDLDDLARDVWNGFSSLNDPPFLFRRDGQLCRVEADDSGFPMPVNVDAKRMAFMLVRLFDWKKDVETKDKQGNKMTNSINVRPPRDLAAHLVADPAPPIPVLHRIVTAPIFTHNHQLLNKSCDFKDGLLYLPPKEFPIREIPTRPTETEIRRATSFIEENLLADFNFTSAPEKANCFAALLTPFVREMISGPTPLFWIDKSKGGSGGTLLSSVIAAPILGGPPAGVTAPRDEAEWGRIILSTLLRSPNLFFIDNCNEPLSSAALASAVTAAKYEGRIIGSSKNESANVRCLWIINGNNLRLGWELARRVVRIRIDSALAHPDQQDSRRFVHPNLLDWVVRNRADVVYQLLVLVMAWEAAGCPGPADNTPEFGSFESWRGVLGGVLMTAGVEGFLQNLDEARREADQESADIGAFIDSWWQKYESKPVTATDLVSLGEHIFELGPRQHAAAIKLGKILGKYENQVYNSRRIRRLAQSQGKTHWQVHTSPQQCEGN